MRLANPKLCPNGLVVDVDINVGKRWDKMEHIDIRTGYAMAA